MGSMDQERLQWITKRPTLDGYTVRVDFADTPSGAMPSVYVEGRCNRKRFALWRHSEFLPEQGGGYTLSDFMCHLALALSVDRPTTQAAFERSMVGESWDQPELPF